MSPHIQQEYIEYLGKKPWLIDLQEGRLRFGPGLCCLMPLVVWPRAARLIALACPCCGSWCFKPSQLSLVNHFLLTGAHRLGILFCLYAPNLKGNPNCRGQNEMLLRKALKSAIIPNNSTNKEIRCFLCNCRVLKFSSHGLWRMGRFQILVV